MSQKVWVVQILEPGPNSTQFVGVYSTRKLANKAGKTTMEGQPSDMELEIFPAVVDKES
jgi:hypothetical protein